MKKIISLLLMVSLLMSMSIISNASSYVTLTSAQKEILYSLGYPEEYSSSLQSYFNNFQDLVSDPFDYGSFTMYGAFCSFVSATRNQTDPDDLEDFQIVARAVYDEVANESGERISKQ